MHAAREEAVQNFLESTEIDRKVMETISRVMAKSPRAVLIAWESDDAFGITAVPFSRSLIKGMVDTAFDAIFGDEEVPESDAED